MAEMKVRCVGVRKEAGRGWAGHKKAGSQDRVAGSCDVHVFVSLFCESRDPPTSLGLQDL